MSCVIELIVTSTCIILSGEINIFVQNCCTQSQTAAGSNHSGLFFLERKEERNGIWCFNDQVDGTGWDCVVSVVTEVLGC